MWLENDVEYLLSVEKDQKKETVLLQLINGSTNYLPLQPGQRTYFEPNSVLTGKIITGVELIPTEITWGKYNSATYYSFGTLRLSYYSLTLIDINGRRVIENCPLNVFYNAINRGKIKRFEMNSIDLQKSYVTNQNVVVTDPLLVIPFQFSYKLSGSNNK